MMGSLITSLDTPVSKTTGGLLVLPKSHALIQRRMQDERTVLSVAKPFASSAVCVQICAQGI